MFNHPAVPPTIDYVFENLPLSAFTKLLKKLDASENVWLNRYENSGPTSQIEKDPSGMVVLTTRRNEEAIKELNDLVGEFGLDFQMTTLG